MGGTDESMCDLDVAQYMRHLWTDECRMENKKAITPEKENEEYVTLLTMEFKGKTRRIRLHTSNAPPPLDSRKWPEHIKLFRLGLDAPKSGKPPCRPISYTW